MDLISISIEHFRCYKEKVTVTTSDLTTFVGKNDIGKSSILEALEIFFNNDTISLGRPPCMPYRGYKNKQGVRVSPGRPRGAAPT